MDIAKGEKVEAELTHLIESRHDQRVVEEGHRPSEEMYEESTRRYQEQMRVRARYEWHLYHRHMPKGCGGRWKSLPPTTRSRPRS